jgi:hypothetical protein
MIINYLGTACFVIPILSDSRVSMQLHAYSSVTAIGSHHVSDM